MFIQKVIFLGVGEDSAYCVPGTVVEADNIMRVKTEGSNPLGIDGGRTQSSGYIKSAESNHVSSVWSEGTSFVRPRATRDWSLEGILESEGV